MLDFVGGAPLAALQLHRGMTLRHRRTNYAADLQGLEQTAGRVRELVSPPAGARMQPELALQWLYWRLARRVRQALEDLLLRRVWRRNQAGTAAVRSCFRQMSQIRELRRVINERDQRRIESSPGC